jgi:DNA-binding IclR family transcriptional regulator
MAKDNRTTGVQTLDRVMAILSLFQVEQPEWGAAEVARELNLTLPTVSRLMRALEGQGLLMRVDGRRFRLGFGAVELGIRASESMEIRTTLRPVLLRLARDTGATAVLGVINETRDSARVIDRVEGHDAIRITLDIGHAWPLHAGALAKALLAHMPERDAVLDQPLPRMAKNTVTDREQLRDQLQRIRERGWATSAEETDSGAWGIAKPVLDESGHPVAAILLIAPLARQSADYADQLVKHLSDAIPEAQRRLGLGAPRAGRSRSSR